MTADRYDMCCTMCAVHFHSHRLAQRLHEATFLANRRSSVLQDCKIRIWHKAGLPIRFRGSWTAAIRSRARPSRNASTRASNSYSFGSSGGAFGTFLCNGESYIPYRSLSIGPHRRQIIAAVDLLSMVALRRRLEGHASRRLTQAGSCI